MKQKWKDTLEGWKSEWKDIREELRDGNPVPFFGMLLCLFTGAFASTAEQGQGALWLVGGTVVLMLGVPSVWLSGVREHLLERRRLTLNTLFQLSEKQDVLMEQLVSDIGRLSQSVLNGYDVQESSEKLLRRQHHLLMRQAALLRSLQEASGLRLVIPPDDIDLLQSIRDELEEHRKAWEILQDALDTYRPLRDAQRERLKKDLSPEPLADLDTEPSEGV